MTLPVFATKDEIPKGFESLYEEKDGKWQPKAQDDATELKTALDAEREKREAAEKLTKKVAADLKALETKAKADAAGLTAEQQKQLRDDVRAELEAEYAPFKEKAADAEKYSTEVRTLKLDNAVRQELAKTGVRAERLDALWKLAGDRFDLTADGKPMVKDKPGLEVGKYSTDTLKAEFPEFYVGTQAAGGGAPGGNGGGVTIPVDASATPEARLIAARKAGKTE